ncbi:glycoside hydrolase family 2 [Paenibacillus glycanilyticus]|uniref:glycoside hydrolase family 2 protein n=1 Tax=Paenibacillus glycanilyticus TaxID=126569 RepID=UPI00203C9F40|nr:sugar-binding domain-containing protein [Paenibacillus glycanilyticus]MCM3626607.1 glycoside hydrolase family 2 [Paenibacillus glycanilyticus]
MTSNLPRADYPRPQFNRNAWECLNGEWEFEFDDARIGSEEGWHAGNKSFSKRIQVPFSFESELSGIGDPAFHDVIWYRRKLDIPKAFQGKRVVLHFGAVDYEAYVWLNGQLVASHEGGHTPFQADITDALRADGDNTLVVKAVDYGTDVFLPRGKQFWEEKSRAIWYTRTTGIWQSVWMEAVSPVHLRKVKYVPDIDTNEIQIRSFVSGLAQGAKNVSLQVKISFAGEVVSEEAYQVRAGEESRKIKLSGLNDHDMDHFWRPERPNLYDVEFVVSVDGAEVDRVTSYFGMRKISLENGKFNLNNRPYFMKLVLDQGYFPDGNLTPPSDEAIKQDVVLMKEMGFNGARKHQKVEDPRFLYWCDQLGLIVWGEMANAYDYSEEYSRRITKEWQEAIDRDYNHPCIAVWVPLNESWGVPNIQIDARQQQHALAMYHLTKSLDTTRLVISNDGWEMVATDLYNIHDYEWRREVLEDRYGSVEKAVSAMPANRRLSVAGFKYDGQPILITEFGGIAYKKSDWEGWGYSGASNDEDFVERLRNVIQPLIYSGVVQGYCYTQLTDVEQEINGLLTYDRKPKVPLELIKAINEGK